MLLSYTYVPNETISSFPIRYKIVDTGFTEEIIVSDLSWIGLTKGIIDLYEKKNKPIVSNLLLAFKFGSISYPNTILRLGALPQYDKYRYCIQRRMKKLEL